MKRPLNPRTQPVPLYFARLCTCRVFVFYLFLYSLSTFLGSFSIGLLKLTKIQLDFCLPSALFILLSSSPALCFIVSFPFVAFVALFQSLLLLLLLFLFLFLAACATRVKLFSKIYDEIVSNFLISSHVAYNLTVPRCLCPCPLPVDGACLVRL